MTYDRPIKTDLKVQDWSEFESALEGIVDTGIKNKVLGDILKPAIIGENTMTDKQHRMIIALFVCELEWSAHDAWKFIDKTLPEVKTRLGKKAIRETELSELYKKINKDEASKLINVLKAISRRKKK